MEGKIFEGEASRVCTFENWGKIPGHLLYSTVHRVRPQYSTQILGIRKKTVVSPYGSTSFMLLASVR